MAIPVHKPEKSEILKCVARFDEISPADTGLPDQEMDGYRRTFYNALGFSQPSGEGSYSPLGEDARPLISHITPGFNLGYVCLLYTSPSPRDGLLSRMPSSA